MLILCFYQEQTEPPLDAGKKRKCDNAGNLLYNLNWSSFSFISLSKLYTLCRLLKKVFKKPNILGWQPQHGAYNKMAKPRWPRAYPEQVINAPAWANIPVPFLY